MRHALALLLVLVFPVLDIWATRRLKRSTDPNKKIKSYLSTMAVLWAASVLAWILDRPGLFYLLEVPNWGLSRGFVYGFAVPLLLVLVLPVFLARSLEKYRAMIQKSMARLSFFLPATSAERWLFIAVSLTAAICEETLYRGYLFNYLVGDWRLAVVAALLLQAGAFGLGHCYQGVRGVVLTAFLGAWFALIYLATGSLLLPMLCHAILDLRILLLPAPNLLTEEG